MVQWVKERTHSVDTSNEWNPSWFDRIDERFKTTKSGKALKVTVRGLCDVLDGHRLIKSKAEIEMLQKAGDIAGAAFKEVEPGYKLEIHPSLHSLYPRP
jgi:Xaa-Pro aminopeptidase